MCRADIRNGNRPARRHRRNEHRSPAPPRTVAIARIRAMQRCTIVQPADLRSYARQVIFAVRQLGDLAAFRQGLTIREALIARRSADVPRTRRRRPDRTSHGGTGRELRDGLTALGFRVLTPAGNGSSIVSMRLDRNRPAHAKYWTRTAWQVSFREQGSMIRVSPGLFNTHDEIERFLGHVKTFA